MQDWVNKEIDLDLLKEIELIYALEKLFLKFEKIKASHR